MGVKAATRFPPYWQFGLLIVFYFSYVLVSCAVTGTNFCSDSAIWAQTAVIHKTASTNEWQGGCSYNPCPIQQNTSARVRGLGP